MRALRRIAAVGARTLVALVALAAGLLVTALVVNRSDRPPSDEVRAFDTRLDERARPADRDNGFVLVLGFAAPREADPWQVGTARADWIRRLRRNDALTRDSDPYPGALRDIRQPEPAAFFEACRHEPDAACAASLDGAGEALASWLERHAWLRARYAALLETGAWRSVSAYDLRDPSEDWIGVSAARTIWFLEAWNGAGDGNAERVRRQLDSELSFWRRVLAGSGSVVEKSIAARYLERHFHWAGLVLDRLPDPASPVPAAWREPISARERSMREAFASELRYSRSLLDGMMSAAPDATFLARLDGWLGSHLLQAQDFVNKRARRLDAIADAVVEPYGRIPAALAAVQADAEPAGGGGPVEALYNPIGDILLGKESISFVDYAARVADVEGVRRAALLRARLSRRGVPPAEVEAALATAELTDPYTGEPFAWDAQAGAIVFDGLERRHGGRRALPYPAPAPGRP